MRKNNFQLSTFHFQLKVIAAGICLILALSAQAQTDMTESLRLAEQEVASGKLNDTEMLEKYYFLIYNYNARDFDKVKLYFQQGINFARKKNNLEWEAKYWGKMGDIYNLSGESDSVMVYYDRALKLIEGKEYFMLESLIYKAIGDFYSDLHNLEKSLSAFHKSLEFIEKDRNVQIALNKDVSGHNRREANIFIDIGAVYVDTRNLEKCEEYLLRAKKILDENPHENNPFYENIIYMNLAAGYLGMKQSEKALPLLLKAYELATGFEDFTQIVFTLSRLSECYRIEKDLKQALNYAKEALKIAEPTHQPFLLNHADEAMMETYRELKDYSSALFYAGRIQERTPDNYWDNMQTLYNGLILIYSAMGNQEKTEEYLEKLKELTLKISDKNLHDALQEMEVKYDVQQKELEILRQQTEIDRYRTRQLVFIGGIIMAVLLLSLSIYIVIQHRRRNRLLAETNATKDKFFSIISHDLKNPVVLQRDSLQMITDYGDKMDADTLSEYHRKTLKLANGLFDLLTNLLDWAKIQTGRTVYNPCPFNLVSVLQSDIGLIKSMAERKGITFEAQTPPAAVVTGDQHMITTVVRNLLTNAVKFTETGGNVSLEITECNGKYTVAVSDTGTGMTLEQLQNLFRIDRQQTHEGTAGEQSSGLGLIVCQDMLHKHGSLLYVESEVGKGSRFWFEV